MKKWFALLLMLSLPLVAGCLTDSGDDDKDDNGSGSGANVAATNFIPLKNGSEYTFQETNYYHDSDEPYMDNYTTKIGGTVTKAGKTYTVMADDYDGWIDSTYVRIADNIMYSYEIFYDITTKLAAKAGIAVPKPADEYGTTIEVPMLNFGATTWDIYTDSYSDEYGSSSIAWTGKYVGRETVTVPAGTFQNCVLFELTFDEESIYTYSGVSATFEYTTVLKIWCAPGVGVVKTHSTETFDDGTGTFEGSDITISDLISYVIP